MNHRGRQRYRLVVGLLSMCALLVFLEWARPGLGDVPPNERRDSTALFYTDLDEEIIFSSSR